MKITRQLLDGFWILVAQMKALDESCSFPVVCAVMLFEKLSKTPLSDWTNICLEGKNAHTRTTDFDDEKRYIRHTATVELLKYVRHGLLQPFERQTQPSGGELGLQTVKHVLGGTLLLLNASIGSVYRISLACLLYYNYSLKQKKHSYIYEAGTFKI